MFIYTAKVMIIEWFIFEVKNFIKGLGSIAILLLVVLVLNSVGYLIFIYGWEKGIGRVWEKQLRKAEKRSWPNLKERPIGARRRTWSERNSVEILYATWILPVVALILFLVWFYGGCDDTGGSYGPLPVDEDGMLLVDPPWQGDDYPLPK